MKRLLPYNTLWLLCWLLFPLQLHAQANAIPNDEAMVNAGKILFEDNCTVCHAIHQEVIGPALADVYDRHSLPWLKAFIRNSQKVIQSGDKTAIKLYEEHNRTQMTSFDFSDKEILSILAYIKQETKVPALTKITAAQTTAPANNIAAAQSNAENQDLLIVIGVLLIVLLLIMILLVILIISLIKFIKQKSDINEEDQVLLKYKFSFKKIIHARAFKVIATLLFLAIVGKAIIDGLYSIGVQQGYAPKQPIAFSHKLHNGKFQIDCAYCHTGVLTGKQANIPSANICMNCHSVIAKEHPEIRKIYAAIENNKPIEWVRIHNLPKLAYFNHAQHVVVGNIDCANCHGKINTMEVVHQHTPLTMGFCIDCHRITNVDVKDNAYYDKLMQLHDKHGQPLKVEDIGGIECGKCHY